MALNDPDGTATLRAHASLHGLARAGIRVGVVDVTVPRNRDMFLRDHEGVRSHTSGSTLAVRAMAYQAANVGEGDVH